MKSATEVINLVADLKAQGLPLQEVAWCAARACEGFPYVYGAVGELCKPAKRAQYGTKFYLKGHTTIVSKCKAISWDAASKTCKATGSCSGCQWNLPVMMFDCRGLTRKILQMVYNWTLMGGTVAGQWNDDSNWKAKGEISTMPRDTLCCLFVYKDGKWQHTGFGFNDATVEASSGVQYFAQRKDKWTHWAVPKVVEKDVKPEPVPSGKAIVTGKNVALRQGPATNTAVMTRIPTGTVVDMAEISGWTYVRFGELRGFFMNEYISIQGDSVTVTGKNLALRQGTNTSSKVLTRVKTGNVAHLEPIPDGWTYVSFNSKKGFMMNEYIRKGDA